MTTATPDKMDSRTLNDQKVPFDFENEDVKAMYQLTDEERLARLGHKQELERRFSLQSLGALCLCMMATWEALSTVIAAALTSGGPPCLFYNYVISFLCSVCIAASLGEIASIYPTSGGQYHWAAALSPARFKAFTSFVTGWVSIGGQIVFTASAAFAAGLQFQSCISISHLDYQPTRIIHIAGFVAILVTLGVLSEKNTASFVFTKFENNSGWASDGVSWLVGLQSAIYPFLGYDAASHLAEEIHQPERDVPLAMVWSVVVNGLIGLVYCIVILFAASPLEKLLSNPYGFPFMQIFVDVTKSNAGATVMSLMLCIVAVAATVAGLTSTSRTLWAFARDKGTPFHEAFSKVGLNTQIPLASVILVTVLELLLGLIYLGNSTAFNAILSMAIIGLYVSYAMPLFCILLYGRHKLKKADFGYFKLGRIGGPILNIIGLIWMVIAIVFSTFPTMMPVTPQNMDYSTVVMAGWLIFGIAFYLWSGRHKFEVALISTEVLEATRSRTVTGG